MADRLRIPRRILEEAVAQRRNAIIRAVITRPQRTLLPSQRSRRDVLSREEIPPSLVTRLQLLPRRTSRSIHTRARFERSHRRARPPNAPQKRPRLRRTLPVTNPLRKSQQNRHQRTKQPRPRLRPLRQRRQLTPRPLLLILQRRAIINDNSRPATPTAPPPTTIHSTNPVKIHAHELAGTVLEVRGYREYACTTGAGYESVEGRD